MSVDSALKNVLEGCVFLSHGYATVWGEAFRASERGRDHEIMRASSARERFTDLAGTRNGRRGFGFVGKRGAG